MNNPGMTNLDISPALASILSMGGGSAPSSAPMGGNARAGLASGMTGQQSFIPSYEAGGMIGVGGMPEPMGMGASESGNVGLAPQGQSQGGAMSPQVMDMQINQFATQHPQELAQIKQSIMQVLQTGELTQQELNMIVQLATVAAQNPEMYSYVRKFAIQQGIATEQDLPQQYDQGLIFVLLLAARAVQADVGGQNMMQGGTPAMAGMSQGSGAIPSMAEGGMTPDS